MDIESKCLQCWHCAEDNRPKQGPQLIGSKSYMCLANPPTASAVFAPNGALAMIASYPAINKESISCARWTPQPSADVKRLIRKGSNDGNAA